MLIQRTSIIEFDDAAEKTRIESVFKKPRDKAVREWLLSIHAAFVAGDFAGAIEHMRNKPAHDTENPLEFVNENVFSVLSEVRNSAGQAIFAVIGSSGQAQ